ncbi:MAG: hypothetical protein MUD08_05370 [Cytophagales bacterium]|nr:hypothetical protein [Cytophagales bacterium]
MSDRMVCQQTPMSCVAACVRQLLRDENVEVSEAEIRASSNYSDENGTEFGSVVNFLNNRHPLKFFHAGVPDVPGLSIAELARKLSRDTGVWVAGIKPINGIQHSVLVDAVETNTVLVRDPWGDRTDGIGTSGAEGEILLEYFVDCWIRGRLQSIFGFPKFMNL